MFYPASSQHLGGNQLGMTHGERQARAYYGGLRAESPAGSRGWAPGGGSGAKPPEAESLVACGRPMETAKLPHSVYFANSIHIGLLCKFDVFRKKNNYGEVWSSINVNVYCIVTVDKKYNMVSVRILSWFGSCTSPFWCSCKNCWAQIRTDDKPGFFFVDLRICQIVNVYRPIAPSVCRFDQRRI